jgi:iron complex outermembrane receptor protein
MPRLPTDARIRTVRRTAVCVILATGFACQPGAVEADVVDPFALSPEQLFDATVTSVSRKSETLRDAPASVYVITGEEIGRSGATSLPEMLRSAPNLEVMQSGASTYQITARGFSGNSAAENSPDKLLVLIDGRSVYNPLYSGVYWNTQDVLPENIERIEVLSGPGGTLWGANAVNGVINVITRKASDTEGLLLNLGGGDRQANAAIQYGGSIGGTADYRVYAMDTYYSALDAASGASAHDGWSKPQGGFRLDWSPGVDQITFEGDIYSGAEAQAGTGNQQVSGANLTMHWQHPLDDGFPLQVLVYYDQARREAVDGGGFVVNSYDFELQHEFTLASWNSIVWGARDRVDQYGITNAIGAASSLLFVPASRTLNVADIFAEDHIAFNDMIELRLGLKLESDPYSGIEPMPGARLSWKLGDDDLLWASVSRAVRSPTPFDVDVVEKLGAVTFIRGNRDFRPEEVVGYELGYRGQFSSRITVSVTAFEDVYDDLKTVEPTIPTLLPLYWGNQMQGNVHGVEAWGSWQTIDWWRLSVGLTIQHEDLGFLPGASGLLGLSQAGDDPRHQVTLRSAMNLSDSVTLDADLRDVGALPDPKVPEYAELNLRLGWRVVGGLELSVSGFNLAHARHLEYVTGPDAEVVRSVLVESKWRL